MRKSLGVLLATAVLGLSTACGAGGSDQRPAAAQAKDDASQAPLTATSTEATTEPSPEASAAPLTRDNFVERLGAAQLEAGSVHLDMTSGAAGTQLAMKGDLRLGKGVESSASTLSMDMGQMSMDLRLVKGVLYLKMGELSRGKYAKVDLTDENSPLAKQFGGMGKQGDPAQQLEVFRSALVDFDDLGDGGEIDGVDTTKVRLVLDTAKVLSQQGGAQAQQAAGSLPKRMTYELYVGRDDDLLRRMTTDLSGATTTIDWSRWGEPVEVKAPSKDEITDIGSLAPGLGGSPAVRG